jgi:periplasmic copper chaperone A
MPHQSRARFSAAGLFALSIMVSPVLAQPQAILVSNAWARATVPAQKTAGVYLDIRSQGAARLVGAATPWAGLAEIHHTVHTGGVVKMLPVKAIELPPGRTVRLTPGGYHIMLTGLKNQLKTGDSMPLTLRVEGTNGTGQEIEVKVDVYEATAGTGKPSHHH